MGSWGDGMERDGDRGGERVGFCRNCISEEGGVRGNERRKNKKNKKFIWSVIRTFSSSVKVTR